MHHPLDTACPMKSFRLEPVSVEQLVESWPAVVILVALGALFGRLQVTYAWARVLIPVFLGFALVPLSIGRLRHKYPTAKQLWLLCSGAGVCLVGVATRTAFPAWQAERFDLVWVGTSFFLILAFVVANRGDKEVV